MDRKEAESKLMELTRGMDIPVYRREDVRFLHKNLHKRNSNHPNFNKLQEHLNIMVDKGWY